MLVAFWSGDDRRDTAGVMALTAMVGCLSFPCKILTMENYLCTHNMGFHLLGKRYDEMKSRYSKNSPENFSVGDTFLQHIRRETGRSIRHNRCIEIIPESLYFLPLNQSTQKDVYEYGFENEFGELMDYGLGFYDFVFINVEQNRNISTIPILDMADEVVVCLPADAFALRDFCERYKSLLHKVYFVFCGQGSTLFQQMLYAKFGDQPIRWTYLEYTTTALAALADGRGLEYLCTHFYDCKGQTEYEFIGRVKEMVYRILQKERRLWGSQSIDLDKADETTSSEQEKTKHGLIGYARELEKLHRWKVAEGRTGTGRARSE